MTQIETVDLLVLGAGWTSTFLIPLLTHENITYAATSTTGRDGTIKFTFDPASNSTTPYTLLPPARTILIVFPLKGPHQSSHLVTLYRKTHPSTNPNFIQLGSTGIFTAPHWNDHNSSYDTTNARAIAEDELMSKFRGATLNLAGLWGGERHPKHWLTRVAKSKKELATKKSLHLVHGEDVARAVIAMHRRFTPGRRWVVTDLEVYDWYQLVYIWGDQWQKGSGERSGGGQGEAGGHLAYREWVAELMQEEGVRALPRHTNVLGRCLDARAFWEEMEVVPQKPLFADMSEVKASSL